MSKQERLTHIEEKLAYLEQYVGELDEVVQDLSLRMKTQADGVSAVRKMIQDHINDPGEPTDLADDKPPHW